MSGQSKGDGGTGATAGVPLVYTVAELATALGFSVKAIRHRIARGQIPGVTRVGRRVVIRRDAVLRWIAGGRGPSPRGSG